MGEEYLKVKCFDSDEIFKINIEVAKHSGTLADLIDEVDTEKIATEFTEKILSAKVWKRVNEFLSTFHLLGEEKESHEKLYGTVFAVRFLKEITETQELLPVTVAASHLDIQPLLKICSNHIADLLRSCEEDRDKVADVYKCPRDKIQDKELRAKVAEENRDMAISDSEDEDEDE